MTGGASPHARSCAASASSSAPLAASSAAVKPTSAVPVGAGSVSTAGGAAGAARATVGGPDFSSGCGSYRFLRHGRHVRIFIHGRSCFRDTINLHMACSSATSSAAGVAASACALASSGASVTGTALADQDVPSCQAHPPHPAACGAAFQTTCSRILPPSGAPWRAPLCALCWDTRWLG